MARLRVALVDDSERIRARLAEMMGEIPNVEIAFAADTEGEAIRLIALATNVTHAVTTRIEITTAAVSIFARPTAARCASSTASSR